MCCGIFEWNPCLNYQDYKLARLDKKYLQGLHHGKVLNIYELF